MKKAFALLLIASLLAMGLPALAEGLSFTPDMVDVRKAKDERLIPDFASKLLGSDSGYDVTVEGNLHIIKTGKVNFVINIPNSYVCFTQDVKASIMMYVLFDVNQSLAEQLAQNNIHMLILDLLNNGELHVKTFNGDALCEMVGDMNDLPEKYYGNVGEVFAEVFSAKYNGMYKTASNVWVVLDDDWLLTIVNGEYVVIEYSCETITDLETEAFYEIANALMVS